MRYGLQCSEKLKSRKVTENKTNQKMKVVPMGLPGVENVPTPRESILTLSRGSQLPDIKKSKKSTKKQKTTIILLNNRYFSIGAR